MTILQTTAGTLSKDIRQGLPNYYLITGKELGLQNEAVQKVQEIATDPNIYGCTEVEHYTDTDTYDIEELVGMSNQLGIFAIKRFVKITIHKERLDAKLLKELDYIAQANDKVHVYCFVISNWDKRSENSAFYKQLDKNHCFQISCDPLKGQQYTSWIRSKLQEYHIKYTAEIPNYLRDRYENNLTGLSQLLLQIKLRGVTNLTVQEIDEISELSSDYNVFDLLKAVALQDFAKVSYILNYLVYTKKEAIPRLLAVIKMEIYKLYEMRYQPEHIENYGSLMDFPIIPNGGLDREQTATLRSKFFDRDKIAAYSKLLSQRMSRRHFYELFIFLSNLERASRTKLNTDQLVVELYKLFMRMAQFSPRHNDTGDYLETLDIHLFDEDIFLNDPKIREKFKKQNEAGFYGS